MLTAKRGIWVALAGHPRARAIIVDHNTEEKTGDAATLFALA